MQNAPTPTPVAPVPNEDRRVQNATAYVYWGAAFLVLILGFRAILETLNLGPEWKTPVTVLAMASLVMEFCLLLFYGNTIRTAKTGAAKDDGSAKLAGVLTQAADAVVGALDQYRGTATALASAAESFGAASKGVVAMQADFRTTLNALHQAIGTLDQRTAALTQATTQLGQFAQHQAASMQKGQDALRTGIEQFSTASQQSLKSLAAQAEGAKTGTDQILQILAGLQKSLTTLGAQTQELQALTRHTTEAGAASSAQFQAAIKALLAPTEALGAAARELRTVATQTYRQQVMMDFVQGVEKTLTSFQSGSQERK